MNRQGTVSSLNHVSEKKELSMSHVYNKLIEGNESAGRIGHIFVSPLPLSRGSVGKGLAPQLSQDGAHGDSVQHHAGTEVPNPGRI